MDSAATESLKFQHVPTAPEGVYSNLNRLTDDALRQYEAKLPDTSECARQLKNEGTVRTQITIGNKGNVTKITPLRAVPDSFVACLQNALKDVSFPNNPNPVFIVVTHQLVAQ